MFLFRTPRRQQPLLSDEQAREVEQILLNNKAKAEAELKLQQQLAQQQQQQQQFESPEPSPPAVTAPPPSATDEPDWLKDVLEAPKTAAASAAIPREKLPPPPPPHGPNGTASLEPPAPPSRNNSTTSQFEETSSNNTTADLLNQTILDSSSILQDSYVSADSSMPSVTTSDSLNLSKQEDQLQHQSQQNLQDPAEADVSADESNNSGFFIPEYPPVKSKEVFVNQDGVHFFEDGNFWMEVPGLLDSDRDDEEDDPRVIPKDTKVKFSTNPMQVFSTFSVNDYDRRNEDVDPVAASAEYELEKRVEKMDVFPVELMKGPEGLGLSIIGKRQSLA